MDREPGGLEQPDDIGRGCPVARAQRLPRFEIHAIGASQRGRGAEEDVALVAFDVDLEQARCVRSTWATTASRGRTGTDIPPPLGGGRGWQSRLPGGDSETDPSLAPMAHVTISTWSAWFSAQLARRNDEIRGSASRAKTFPCRPTSAAAVSVNDPMFAPTSQTVSPGRR